MLAADKLLLQSEVKQRAINLRERELKLFNSNFSAVGSQSAIMAGFTLTSFVEIDLPPERAFAKGVLHFFITASVCVNFICVAMVMFVTVWGSGKALRGLDGEKDPRNLLLYLQLLRTLCQRCEEQRAPGFDVSASQLETDAAHTPAATLCTAHPA